MLSPDLNYNKVKGYPSFRSKMTIDGNTDPYESNREYWKEEIQG